MCTSYGCSKIIGHLYLLLGQFFCSGILTQSLLCMKVLLLANLLAYLQVAFVAFGVTTSGSNMVVDSGGLLERERWLL